MSWQALGWATKQRVGDSSLKLLLIILANYVNEEGEAWHSQKRISFDTEIPERTLRRKMTQLVDMGLIEVTERRRENGSRTTSLVRLISDQPAKMADCETASGQTGQRPESGLASGQNGELPAATKVAGPDSSENHSEPSMVLTREGDARQSGAWPKDHVEMFWNLYPEYRRSAKKTVAAKLATLRRTGEVTWDRLMDGLRRYVASKPGEYAKGPVVWLNGGCWDDTYDARGRVAERRPSGGNGFATLLRERMENGNGDDFDDRNTGSDAGFDGARTISGPAGSRH
jgi:hypothetical protein